MISKRNEHQSAYSSRRSVLAALSGVVSVGLAGCSGSDGDTETATPDGEETTETATQNGGASTATPAPSGEDGSSNKLDIPGEVVHNDIDTVAVLDHGAYAISTPEMNIRVTIENNGDQPLMPDPIGGADNPIYIRARTLTSEGNQLQTVQIDAGPDEINPGTEATLTSRTPVDEAAEYELCIVSQDPLLSSASTDWEDVCSG